VVETYTGSVKDTFQQAGSLTGKSLAVERRKYWGIRCAPLPPQGLDPRKFVIIFGHMCSSTLDRNLTVVHCDFSLQQDQCYDLPQIVGVIYIALTPISNIGVSWPRSSAAAEENQQNILSQS